MQFGADPRLAAQCVPLPLPSGYRPWAVEIDGPMPPAIRDRAERFGAEEPIGAELATSTPSHSAVMIRSEPRAWRENPDRSISHGCFQVGAVYVPHAAAEKVTAPSRTKLEITVAVLTAISLTVGTAVTLASWRRRKRK